MFVSSSVQIDPLDFLASYPIGIKGCFLWNEADNQIAFLAYVNNEWKHNSL